MTFLCCNVSQFNVDCMASLCSLTLIFVLINLSTCLEFTDLLGKKADPCNSYLDEDVSGLQDCASGDEQLTTSSVTVLIPSISTVTVPDNPDTHRTGTSVQSTLITLTTGGLNETTSYLALATADGSCATIESTTVIAASTRDEQLLDFYPNSEWVTLDLELEEEPRLLCWSSNTTNWRYTGFKVKVVWNCNDEFSATQCSSTARSDGSSSWTSLTANETQERLRRTYCCKETRSGSLLVGQCINNNFKDCCGGSDYEIATQECCSTANGWIAAYGACPCSTSDDCPTDTSCCLPSKYSSITTSANLSSCYRTADSRCCDTGEVFDPGAFQCCQINGIQSLDVQCPCGEDSHCRSPDNSTDHHLCCLQTAPTVDELQTCSTYASYLSGQGDATVCNGVCMDPYYSVCCNGATCVKNFETCCNNTCCNTRTSSCLKGVQTGSSGNPSNPLNFHSGGNVGVFEYCSEVEHLDERRGFWVYVMPSLFTAATVVSTLLVAAIVPRASNRVFSTLENATVIVASVIMVLAIPLYFAPLYKYALWVIWAQLVVIATASMQIIWLHVLCVVVNAATVIYLLDAFHGNALLTMAYDRIAFTSSAPPSVASSGLLASTTRLWLDGDISELTDSCTKFYYWFSFDTSLQDTDRLDNPNISTFGYCSRDWITSLLIFGAAIVVLCILQLLLSVVGLAVRFPEPSERASRL